MTRVASRRVSRSALAGAMVVMGALALPSPAAAHCGEHADSCSVPDWREVGSGCEPAADPFEYGTWLQQYELIGTWCNFPVMCPQTRCGVDAPCGANSTCVNGTCSCPPGRLAECASCGAECTLARQSFPYEHDSRCWPWGVEAQVPCAGPVTGEGWRNHGGYVRALADLLNLALKDGLIDEAQRDGLMAAGAESGCGT